MSVSTFDIPVLILTFNREDTVKKVFDAVKFMRPSYLYIASDGPRDHVEGEEGTVLEIRKFLTESVDWDCCLRTKFSEKNLGCKEAVSSALTWFFANEEMGIVLEDDCLPSRSFFYFCESLLHKYREDERVFLISGHNKQNVWGEEDYFFSYFGGIWGWASWRRAWNHYDGDMTGFDEFVKAGKFESLLGEKVGRLRKKELIRSKVKSPNSWAYPWAFARHKNHAVACVPKYSLVKNIGFGETSTHTKGSPLKRVDQNDMSFPLKENSVLVPDLKYDKLFLSPQLLWYKVIVRIRDILKGLAK